MLTQCGLKKFVAMHEDTYVDLITEFYTTLDVNESNSQILKGPDILYKLERRLPPFRTWVTDFGQMSLVISL